MFHKISPNVNQYLLLHRLEESVRVVRVEDLVASHHGYQIFRFRQIDDVVGPAGNHVNRLNFVPGNFKLQDVYKRQPPDTSRSILPTAASGSRPTVPVRGGCTDSRAQHIDLSLIHI